MGCVCAKNAPLDAPKCVFFDDLFCALKFAFLSVFFFSEEKVDSKLPSTKLDEEKGEILSSTYEYGQDTALHTCLSQYLIPDLLPFVFGYLEPG
jgi:hypothetical protein